VRKVIITTSADPREPWGAVHALTFPRFRKYAELHGYDFKPIWYDDIDHAVFPEFRNPQPFVEGAVNFDVRADFIRWKMDRNLLAPNWLRYAAILQLIDYGEYDVVVYVDGDLVVGDFETDFMTEIPSDKWLIAPINGPDPNNAGPGGPLLATRACAESREFWRKVWFAKKWIMHPWWTDGVDFMDMLGYTINPPIHKERATEYDASWFVLPSEWVVWFGANPNTRGKFYHPGGGSGRAEEKVGEIERMIREKGI
jgi:hypothetical protein